jgi:hypothetical protein
MFLIKGIPSSFCVGKAVSLNGVSIDGDGHALDGCKLLIRDSAGNGDGIKQSVQSDISSGSTNSLFVPELIGTGVCGRIFGVVLVNPVGRIIAVEDAGQICAGGSKDIIQSTGLEKGQSS